MPDLGGNWNMDSEYNGLEETGICVGCGVSMIDSVKTAQEIVDEFASAFGL